MWLQIPAIVLDGWVPDQELLQGHCMRVLLYDDHTGYLLA